MNYDYPLIMLSLPVIALITAYGIWKVVVRLFRWVRRMVYQFSIVVLSQFTYVKELHAELDDLRSKLVLKDDEIKLLTETYMVKTEKSGQMRFQLPTENKPYTQTVVTNKGTFKLFWNDVTAYQSHMLGKIPVTRNGKTLWVKELEPNDKEINLSRFYNERKI